MLALFLAQTPYLNQWPPWGYNEAASTDIGRVILGGDSGWSFNWASRGEPVRICPVLACTSHELAYRALGTVGPRFVSMLGTLVAALLLGLLAWRWTGDELATGLVACGFFTDQMVTVRHWMVRNDGWAMAWVFGAIYLTLRATVSPHSRPLAVAAGPTLAASLAGWYSAPFLFPLYAVCLVNCGARRLAPFAGAGFLFGLGLQAAAALATGANYGDFEGELRGASLPWTAIPRATWYAAKWLVLTCPDAMAAALIGLFASGLALPVALAASIVALPMLLTGGEERRLVYLIPYCYVMGVLGFRALSAGPRRGLRPVVLCAMALAVMFGAFQTVRLRYRGIVDGSKEPGVESLRKAAEDLGRGKRIALLIGDAFYFEGRRLGWRMYRIHLLERMNPDQRAIAMAKLGAFDPDYVIVEKPLLPGEANLLGVSSCQVPWRKASYGAISWQLYCRTPLGPSGSP